MSVSYSLFEITKMRIFILNMILLEASWHEMYKSWLQSFDKSNTFTTLVYNGSIIFLTVLLGVLAYKFGKWIVSFVGKKFAQNDKFRILRILANNKFYIYLSLFFPLLVAYYTLSILIHENTSGYGLLEKAYTIIVITIIALLINSILNTIIDLNKYKGKGHYKPIKGLIQFIQILIYFFVAVICVSILFTNSPWKLVGGLGALSAVLLLIFRDSILGLVGGVQLSINETIEIGDSITLPEYHADGQIIDITLTSIKVRNWDNSISTIPSYNLTVTNAIKNWRNETDMAARRISSFIPVDMETIKVSTPEMIDTFKKTEELSEFMKNNEEGFVKDNPDVTNLDIFRIYVYSYLNKRKDIKKDADIIVKIDEPSFNGLPVGIYCFVNTTQAKEYETIRAEIFAQLVAKLSLFNLKIYQTSTT